MKKILNSMVLLLPILFLTSCNNDDDNGGNPSMNETKTYQLRSVTNPAISGTAKFIKNADNSTTIELQLNGTPSGGQHPAHIHNNSAAEGGAIVLDLGTVNGDTGFSAVTVSALNDATPISYEELLDFDGYINVHLSATELEVLVAQEDIGQNELTGTTKSYDLNSVSDPNISGIVSFSERKNGEALATLNLEGTIDGTMYPAHIHMGSAASPAPSPNIIFTFNSVDGATGISKTNVSALNDATAFDYADILQVDGYVNVHNPEPADLSILVAQGDIGHNEFAE